jgi:phenylalanyl-tRNA synthetase beta chain
VRRFAEDAMAGRGLYEIVGWSFTEPGLLDRLLLPKSHPLRSVVAIENPLSEDLSILRPTLAGSLLDAARHNLAHGASEIAIFESGTVYRADDGPTGADEHLALGVLLSGALTPRSWRGERVEADFYSAKALLEGLLEGLHVDWSVAAAEPERWPFLHPGRTAVVLAAEETLGFIGELHPLVAAAWDLPRSAAFAIDLGKLASATPEAVLFAPFGAYPELRQDIAVTLPDEVSAARLLDAVRSAAGATLGEARVFDVYSGEQVGAGRRSLAVALSFRSREGTLTDEDVAPLREKIVAAVAGLGGELRG